MESHENRQTASLGRRGFLALVGGITTTAGGINLKTAPMPLDRSYRIADHYYIGPERFRPDPSDAEGTVWEVTTTKGTATERTVSNGQEWITLNIETDLVSADTVNGERYVSPEQGVKGIQAAIDRTGGRVVVRLGPGEYVGSDLRLDDGVTLVGAGRNATTIRLENDANTDLVRTANVDETNVMECTFRDITFRGNRSANDNGHLVYGAFWNSRFIDCNFFDAPEHGVWLAGSTGSSTDDNQFRGCQFVGNAGAGIRGGTNREANPAVGVVRVDTNWFGANGTHAIRGQGFSWKIHHCKFYDFEESDDVDKTAVIELDRTSYATVTSCDISTYSTGASLIYLRARQGAGALGNQIKNNDFRSNYQQAIHCEADGNDIVATQVQGNTFQTDGDSEYGIRAVADADGSFVGCVFRDNLFVDEYARAAIEIPESWDRSRNTLVNYPDEAIDTE